MTSILRQCCLKRGLDTEGGEGVEVKDPRRALVTLLEYFDNERRAELPGTHETAVISKVQL